ncbi:MAG: CRTAC1 family protein, partial [Pseudomonadota bacterium]
SATTADYDGDGLLDLFVTHYVDAPIEDHKACTNALDEADYCSPTAYKGTADTLWRNLGGLEFANVSESAGIRGAKGAGLGVLASDLDGDGATDFFVANDQSANFLWRNAGEGRFEELGLLSGSAYNAHGMAEASMGVTAADFDGDGDDDLFMTHLNAQTNTLYVNDGAGGFRDATDEAQLGSASLVYTGFGARWFDVDNDGDLDIFTANGAVITEASQAGQSDFPYAQTNQLFMLGDDGRYRDASDEAGVALDALAVSRGAAFGDLDNDGDIDILIANAHAAPQLLENVWSGEHHWLGVTALERTGRRVAIGARVGVVRSDRVIWRRVARGGSYLSSNDPRVHFGLAQRGGAVDLQVRWPDGSHERFENVDVDRYVTIVQGQGASF